MQCQLSVNYMSIFFLFIFSLFCTLGVLPLSFHFVLRVFSSVLFVNSFLLFWVLKFEKMFIHLFPRHDKSRRSHAAALGTSKRMNVYKSILKIYLKIEFEDDMRWMFSHSEKFFVRGDILLQSWKRNFCNCDKASILFTQVPFEIKVSMLLLIIVEKLNLIAILCIIMHWVLFLKAVFCHTSLWWWCWC